MRAPLTWPYHKVSILEVESLLPFSAWFFLGCKSTNILYKLGVKKIENYALTFITFMKYIKSTGL